MNWTASLLRNQLQKERKAHQEQINLLASTNQEAQEYLDLEQKLKQTEENLKLSEELISKLKTESDLKEKDQVKALESQEAQITKLEKKIKASKELIFNIKKEVITNQLYYQTELRKVTESQQTKFQEQTKQLKQQVEHLNSQKEQLITKAEQYLQTLDKSQRDLKDTEETLAETTNSLLETKELLSIYQNTDALSFFNTNPSQVVKVLHQHPTKLYYLFYSTENPDIELDLSSLAYNLEDNCLFLGTFKNGSLEVNLSKEQAEVIKLRTPRKPEELFQFSKQKLFISDTTKLFKKGELLTLGKGKASATTPQPGISPSPTMASNLGEEKKKRGLFGRKKDK